MESKWFVRGLALVLALLLYATAFIDEHGSMPRAGDNTSRERIENVPVTIYYDEELFVVTDAPQFVDVIVEGNSGLVQSVKNLRDFEVYIDLTNAKIGDQTVELKIRDISDKLRVTIDPPTAVVNVQEKVTEEFSVEAEFSSSLLEEGYTAEQPIIEPNTVKITGGKDIINSIAYVRAIIETSESINETFTYRATITVLDEKLNKLDVIVEPDKVDVTIPVVPPKKTVPIVIKQQGTPKEGIIIRSIDPHIREIVISGKKSVLDKIESIEIPVDVSDIDSNQELTIPIELEDGIISATPDSVNVTITVDVEERRTITGIPIEYVGLEDGLVLQFLTPENGQVDLTVRAASAIINALGRGDFTVTIDVENLDVGEHRIDLDIRGPDGVKWDASVEKAVVLITPADADDEP